MSSSENTTYYIHCLIPEEFVIAIPNARESGEITHDLLTVGTIAEPAWPQFLEMSKLYGDFAAYFEGNSEPLLCGPYTAVTFFGEWPVSHQKLEVRLKLSNDL